MHDPDALTDLFRANGRKVTAQRQCIFRSLQGNEQHPSAEMVYDVVRAEMETISLKTVYQTLNDLADLGEIAALDLGTGMLRFDPNVEDAHHHLVCRSCGKVRDLFVSFGELEVPPAHARGYDVRSAEVVFRGLCDECRLAAPAPGPRGAPAAPLTSPLAAPPTGPPRG
jgi:Fur family transcriptional regulator, stress-responsive regulator